VTKTDTAGVWLLRTRDGGVGSRAWCRAQPVLSGLATRAETPGGPESSVAMRGWLEVGWQMQHSNAFQSLPKKGQRSPTVPGPVTTWGHRAAGGGTGKREQEATAFCPPCSPSLAEAQGSQQSTLSCPPALGSLAFAGSPFFSAAL